jgi:hypothetical protein
MLAGLIIEGTYKYLQRTVMKFGLPRDSGGGYEAEPIPVVGGS